MVKLPSIIETAANLASEAVSILENAKSETGSLNAFEAAKATAALIDIGSTVPKIPAFMRQTVETLKEYVLEIKEAVEYI